MQNLLCMIWVQKCAQKICRYPKEQCFVMQPQVTGKSVKGYMQFYLHL